MCAIDRWEHSVAWLSSLSFLTHYPGGPVVGPRSGLLLLLINLLHQPLQVVSIFPEATLHPAEHLRVQLPVAGQSQVVF